MNTKLEQFQSNVKHLTEIAQRLSDRSDECALGSANVYHVEGGTARVWVLFETPDVSVVKATLSPGAMFPVHRHDAAEVIVLYKGAALYSSIDATKALAPGDCVRVPRAKAHKITAGPDGASFSVTTVPREPAFSELGSFDGR